MKYLSVCSGIEAASVAWDSLGWEPVAFSEIEPFPSAVLAERFPDVPNLGDMTKYHEWNIPAIDLMVGGTPCQAFSVAGKRGSLGDDRGNLCLTFCRMADHFAPKWVLWENVLGVLSTPDNAFGCFLGALCGADAPVIPPGRGRKHPNSGVVFTQNDAGRDACVDVAPTLRSGHGGGAVNQCVCLPVDIRHAIRQSDNDVSGKGWGDVGDPMYTLTAGGDVPRVCYDQGVINTGHGFSGIPPLRQL